MKELLDKKQRLGVAQGLLNIILPFLFLLMMATLVILVSSPHREWRRVYPVFGLMAFFAITFMLNRWGKTQVAIIFYTLMTNLLLLLAMLFNGGVHALAFFAFSLVLLPSVIFFRWKVAFLIFLQVMLCSMAIYLLQMNQLLPSEPLMPLFYHYSVNVLIFLLEMVVMAASFHLLKKHMKQNVRQSAQLELKEQFNQAVLDSVGDGIIAVDTGGKVLKTNPNVQELLNLESIENGAILDLLQLKQENGQDYPLMEKLSQAISRTSLYLERAGHLVPIRLSGETLKDSQGSVYGTVLTIRDISKERELQKQLLQSQKMEAIGQLASGVAHDFNNMLGGILVASDHLEEALSGEDLEMLKVIQSAGEKASDLTRKLLDFGRHGKMISTAVDIHTIISDSVEMLKQIIDRSIVIKMRMEAEYHFVVGDDSQISNGLVNMAINASHAMPKGGTLTISTSDVYLDDDYCANHSSDIKSGNYICLNVKDTGRGIPKKVLPKIFEPFFTTKSQGEGTGLGLSAVMGMVESHKGTMTVYSEEGMGTSFNIYLPASKGRVSQVESGFDESMGDGETVLVVDDEKIILATVKVMLEKLNYKVLTAPGGKEALDILDQQKVDLVLLDMIMPEMNGRRAFELIQEKVPGLPVVLSSGFSKKEDVDSMKEQGLKGFIRKPYSKGHLADALKKAFVS